MDHETKTYLNTWLGFLTCGLEPSNEAPNHDSLNIVAATKDTIYIFGMDQTDAFAKFNQVQINGSEDDDNTTLYINYPKLGSGGVPFAWIGYVVGEPINVDEIAHSGGVPFAWISKKINADEIAQHFRVKWIGLHDRRRMETPNNTIHISDTERLAGPTSLERAGYYPVTGDQLNDLFVHKSWRQASQQIWDSQMKHEKTKTKLMKGSAKIACHSGTELCTRLQNAYPLSNACHILHNALMPSSDTQQEAEFNARQEAEINAQLDARQEALRLFSTSRPAALVKYDVLNHPARYLKELTVVKVFDEFEKERKAAEREKTQAARSNDNKTFKGIMCKVVAKATIVSN